MLHLEEFKKEDAKIILSWCDTELAFRKWSADQYKTFPAAPEEMQKKYESPTTYPLCLFDDNELVGHLIVRFVAEREMRIGFVIVDPKKRKRGYGKQLLEMSIQYAYDHFDINKLGLGVFENNIPALKCYQSVGFEIIENEEEYYSIFNEKWRCIELDYKK